MCRCNTHPCPKFRWFSPGWKECVTSTNQRCGSGTKTREVVCRNIHNLKIALPDTTECIEMAGKKPSTSERFFTKLFSFRTPIHSVSNHLSVVLWMRVVSG